MRDIFEAIRDRLTAPPTAVPTYFVSAPKAPESYPYALLWGGSGLLDDGDLANRGHLDDTFSVTWVSKSSLGVLDLRALGRASLHGWTPPSATWQMQPITLLPRMGQDVRADLDATFPDTNLPAFFAVDQLRLAGDLT